MSKILLVGLLLLLSQLIHCDEILMGSSSSIPNYRELVKQGNRKKIEQHNSLIGVSFKMKQYPRFAHLTIHELQETYLAKLSKEAPISRKTMVQAPRPSSNPSLTAYFPSFKEKRVNWTQKGMVSSVKQQGACGSCYAFAAMADIESSFLFKGKQLDLSEQHIIDCSFSFGNSGCEGGWMATVFAYAMIKGITSEERYPMTNQTFEEGNPGSCLYEKGEFKIKNYAYTSYRTYDCDGLTRMVEKRPVTVAIAASFEFFFYYEGILTVCGEEINHGVQLTGLIEIYPENYWIIKNSWGNWWGMSGFGHIDRYSRYGNLCEICYAPSYSII